MKIRTTAFIYIAVGLLLSGSGCAKQQPASGNSSVQTNASVTRPETTETVADATYDKKSIEAKKVIVDFLNTLAKDNIKAYKLYCIEQNNTVPYKIRIDSVRLIKIADDVGERNKRSYLNGRGAITKPYDAITFSVTYDIQYNKEDEKMATEDSGVKTKWFNLAKLTKNSPWKIDEIGY